MSSASTLAAPPQRVLVVDPDAQTRALYERSFTSAGLDVVHAADGREALTKALVHPPSLVVMELRLPLIDGFALCEILKRDLATTRTPILTVTAETRPVQLERIRRLGADEVLVKPVPLDVLAARVVDLVAASDDSGQNADLALRGNRLGLPNAERPSVQAEQRSRTAKAKTRREVTLAPPLHPPALSCPTCNRALAYQCSHIGGVSDRHPEQWDYFSCSACGGFQYRQRTRKLRHLDESEEHWLQRQRASGV
jgi:DNA-binding response OmpR family regulator